jgi:perosamine synthetase
MNVSFHSVISASLSPNTERDDVFLSFQLLFSPWRWKRGKMVVRAEDWFKKKYPTYHVWSFNSGRSALFSILRAFDIGQGDDVLIQAFTCVAVPNSVLWTGAKPVYVDVDKTLNIDTTDAARKITSRTRAIIVQHTFGVPADMDAISAFAKKHKIILIEDCAHSLGVMYRGVRLGSLSDASFFSFGRDKVVSSVFGGMGLIRKTHQGAVERMKHIYKGLPYPSFFWIAQQLFHPVIFSIVLPFYRIGAGKVLLVACQRLRLLSFPVYAEEKKSRKPDDFPSRLPNVLSVLLFHQLSKLAKYTAIRIARARYYGKQLTGVPTVTLLSSRDEPVFLRFPLLVENPRSLIGKAKKNAVLIGNWYHNCIDPVGVDLSKAGYRRGACPNAERYAGRIINLPTLVSEKQAHIVLKQIVSTAS